MKKPIDPPRTCQGIEGGAGTSLPGWEEKIGYHSVSVDHALDTVLFARDAGPIS